MTTLRGGLAVMGQEVTKCCRNPSTRTQVLHFLPEGPRMKDKNKDRARVRVCSWDSRRSVLKEIQEDLQSKAVLKQVVSESG